MEQNQHQLELCVRDYECDLQGVVNNAVYLNYLEHARHEYLRQKGLDFAALASEGINLMVIRAEIDYRGSLRSGDSFIVQSRYEQKSRLKFLFKQEIVREGESKALLRAEITGTAVNKAGKPFLPPELALLLDEKE
ncbi:MAG: 4-hydroxybenzoyl-CoA thioesterase [Gammaproteobacteria bacterium]|nr:4-hydroxybenzoyl-CoA thioesterase [Gammaproteobacteria bacterium]MAY02433.1 4-hydroxybenzoyl-CoA thioesterase [Gammaproteobacteria bacterium]